MNKIKIIVTGGSGFIGTNLIDKLISEGYQIINFDIKEPKNKYHRIYWKFVNISDFSTFRNMVKEFDPHYIVHLAARTDLDGTSLDDYDANTIGVENLMNIVKELSLLKKIVITSSMLVCHGGYYPKDQFDYNPTTIYGESKVITEKNVWANKPKCDWALLRPTSIWGPWFGIPYRTFFDLVISKKYFHIGNRGCTKTYGYIENAVYQIEKILFSQTIDEKKKVFFLGDNPPINIEEWGNEIANELGYKIIKMPYTLIKYAALFGDILNFFGKKFPINSFRLHNMTTNNTLDLKNTYEIAPDLPFNRVEGVKRTLAWIKEIENI